VNAHELLAALGGLPGVRRVPVAANGVTESVLISRVEIARAEASDERALRRTWRSRYGGGPDPLLLVVDDPERPGALRALGPVAGDGPVRVVSADDLLPVLRRLTGLSALQAPRELAEELDRLDRTGVAGLVVRGLGTEHLYRTRLRAREAQWAELAALAAGATGEWREAFQGLGYGVEQLPARGYLARYENRPVAVIWPLREPSDFSKLDAEGRPPEGVLLNECLSHGAPYGFLVCGARFRLFEAGPESGSAVARYLELDGGALAEEDRPLLGLLSPPYLAGGGLATLMREARSFGAELRKRLDQAIRQSVLPGLGLDLGRWARAAGWDLTDDDRRRELEAAALTFVFRSLFLLYAESAGHLPVTQEAYERNSFKRIVRDAYEQRDRLDPRSTSLWDRIQVLVHALRTGDDALAVPPYNGDLFAPDGFEGASVLEGISLPNPTVGQTLVGLGIDPDSADGYDFSGLEIGHLGHIYEGLLSLRLSVADRDYRYDARHDRYVAAAGDEAEIHAGEVLWLTDEGGRKGGGVYYTPELLVRHLVRRGVLPAFERHLEDVAALTRTDPDAAARRLFAFRVLDPACGSAHFLVAVVDELADRVARHLGKHPLPLVRRELDDLRAGAGATYGIGIEDVQLLRRLVLRRCVYGVDLSPMGAEIAKISLWLASFVPGLSLSYLDHNVRVGNSLIGVAGADELVDGNGVSGIAADVVRRAMGDAASAAAELFTLMDRTPDEVERSEEVDRRMREKTRRAQRLLDVWIAEPLGHENARSTVLQDPGDVADGTSDVVEPASRLDERYHGFHWPVEFPEVFSGAVPGFDAVVGNPPWEEITVEELAFYARYEPGLRALPEPERDRALERLRRARPELEARLEAERDQVAALKRYFYGETGYDRGAGDPDLYKFFCQRYRTLLTGEGSLAVVLPRTAFLVKGSADFRRWLFERSSVRRLDFLVNTGRWAFDAEPRYTTALVIADAVSPTEESSFEVAGVADSERRFAEQSASRGIALVRAALGPIGEVPLLPSQAAADLLGKLRRVGSRFAYGGGRWRCFPTRELHETDDKLLWEEATEGLPIWKGESFDQYDPHGAETRLCPAIDEARKRATRARAGNESLLATEVPLKERYAAHVAEAKRARVAFRDVTNRTNSRTVVTALIPPNTFLVNSAPYLVFLDGRDLDRACCLGVMNSCAFDWQARRFVETHLSYFILEGLCVPDLGDERYEAIAGAAARLSCVDERFADFAAATGVEVGRLELEEREQLRAEIDAHVAAAWGLDAADLEVIFSDFTLGAVPEAYRSRVRRRFAELRS